jgi:ubiquinone/menaquinone biosynthesis C-methylase UbiE
LTPYELFARYYDGLLCDIDYEKRAEYFSQLFMRHGVRPQIVLDLACGTGSLSIALANAGYDVIGIDRSPEMLSAAVQKAGSTNKNILLLCQDMCELDLYGTVDAAICHLDGINHLTSPQAVCKTFEKVSLFLNDGGLFVFDLNSPYKIAYELGNHTFVYDYDDIYCVWQNSYSPSSHLCSFDLTFFERSGEAYRRYDEHFAERAYTTRQIKSWLAKAGLTLCAEYDDFSFDAPYAESKRIIYVAAKGNILKGTI